MLELKNKLKNKMWSLAFLILESKSCGGSRFMILQNALGTRMRESLVCCVLICETAGSGT